MKKERTVKYSLIGFIIIMAMATMTGVLLGFTLAKSLNLDSLF